MEKLFREALEKITKLDKFIGNEHLQAYQFHLSQKIAKDVLKTSTTPVQSDAATPWRCGGCGALNYDCIGE